MHKPIPDAALPPSHVHAPLCSTRALRAGAADTLQAFQPVAAEHVAEQLLGFMVGSVSAGFPSPAEDHSGKRLDLFERLNTHPQATYFMRVRGLSMIDAGIGDGDVVVVNRAIKPRSGHIVVAVVDGEFTVKQLSIRAGVIKLKAANPTFKDICMKEGQELSVWGVVKAALKEFPT
jgi:DNA polymerase V